MLTVHKNKIHFKEECTPFELNMIVFIIHIGPIRISTQQIINICKMEDRSLLLDKVLFDFANPIDSDEDEDYEDPLRWEAFEQMDTAPAMSLPKSKKEEFLMAFEVVSNKKLTIARNQVFDVILALGFTFQEDDMEQ